MPRHFGTTGNMAAAAAPSVDVAGGSYYNTGSRIVYASDGSAWYPVFPNLPAATASSTLVTFTDSQGGVWVAKSTISSGAWFRATQVCKSRLYRAAAWTPTNGTSVPFDQWDVGSTWAFSNGTTWTCPVTGDYLVSAQIIANVSQQNWLNVGIRKGGSTVRSTTLYNGSAAANNVTAQTNDVIQFAASDTSDIYLTTNQGGSLAGGTGSGSTWVSYRYLSPQ